MYTDRKASLLHTAATRPRRAPVSLHPTATMSGLWKSLSDSSSNFGTEHAAAPEAVPSPSVPGPIRSYADWPGGHRYPAFERPRTDCPYVNAKPPGICESLYLATHEIHAHEAASAGAGYQAKISGPHYLILNPPYPRRLQDVQ